MWLVRVHQSIMGTEVSTGSAAHGSRSAVASTYFLHF